MADAKITELTEKTASLSKDDLFVIVDTDEISDTTKKIKKSTFLDGITIDVIKNSAGTIAAGKLVRLVSYDGGNAIPTVELADNSAAGTMPAYGIAVTTITDAAIGKIVIIGSARNINTSAFVAGDVVYASTSGDLTTTKPQGTALIQRIGRVIRSDASLGIIEISGAGRSNDLPNLAQNYIWMGDANGVPQQVLPVKNNWLQYTNNAAQTTTVAEPTYTKVSFNTDMASNNSESYFTKVNATDFRVNFTGYVDIAASATIFNANTNDKPVAMILQKNGTAVTGTLRYCTAKNTSPKANTAAFKVKQACTTNDIFSLGFANALEAAGDNATILANACSFTIERLPE